MFLWIHLTISTKILETFRQLRRRITSFLWALLQMVMYYWLKLNYSVPDKDGLESSLLFVRNQSKLISKIALWFAHQFAMFRFGRNISESWQFQAICYILEDAILCIITRKWQCTPRIPHLRGVRRNQSSQNAIFKFWFSCCTKSCNDWLHGKKACFSTEKIFYLNV